MWYYEISRNIVFIGIIKACFCICLKIAAAQHQDLYLQYVMKTLVIAPAVQITPAPNVTIVPKAITDSPTVYHATVTLRVH